MSLNFLVSGCANYKANTVDIEESTSRINLKKFSRMNYNSLQSSPEVMVFQINAVNCDNTSGSQLQQIYTIPLPQSYQHQPLIAPQSYQHQLLIAPELIKSANNTNNGVQQPVTRPNKPKRIRTVYTSYQLAELEREFKQNGHLDRIRRYKICQRLSLNEDQVKVWFQNRRMKEKRDQIRRQESEAALLITEPSTSASSFQREQNYTFSTAISTTSSSDQSTTDPINKNYIRPEVTEIMNYLMHNLTSTSQNTPPSFLNRVTYSLEDLDSYLQTVQQGLNSTEQSSSTSSNESINNLNHTQLSSDLETSQLQRQTNQWVSSNSGATPYATSATFRNNNNQNGNNYCPEFDIYLAMLSSNVNMQIFLHKNKITLILVS